MKDKEWLKETLRKDLLTYIGNTSKRNEIIDLIDQLEEQEKVVVPQFVADDIEQCKGYDNDGCSYDADNDIGLASALDYDRATMSKGVEQYLNRNSEVYARAWLDGYSVAEKLYRVRLPITVWDEESSELQEHWYYLVYDNTSDETRLVQSLRAYEHYQAELSETLIKSIDERFWAFAVEVTE